MRTFYKVNVVVLAILIGVIFTVTANAEETAKKLDRPKLLDGITFNVDGTWSWADSYVNTFRPGIQYWLDENAIDDYARSIRNEVNLLLYGAGITQEEVEARVKNNISVKEIFRRSFCTEVEYAKKNKNGREIRTPDGDAVNECKKICVGDPDDYIVLVTRKLADTPTRNTCYLFTYISKEKAYELGCRDRDVVDYVERKK